MSVKSVLLLVAILVTSTVLVELKDNDFIAVSTTQSPGAPVTTTILEKQLEFCIKTEENNLRLISAFESCVKQTQKTCDNEQKVKDELFKKQFDKIEKTLAEEKKRNDELIKKSLEKDQQISEMNKTLEELQKRSENSKKIINLPADCAAVKRMGGQTSGIYRIKPEIASTDFLVRCDMTIKEGGWTYVINRFDGSQNFNLNWTDYKSGFGNLWGEFWIGLEHLYQLTNSKSNELLFEMIDWDLKKVYANYKTFKIKSESDGYSLEVGGYSGDAGDSFSSHGGSKFSTPDRDQDTHTSLNCAAYFNSAWWYSACFSTNPTGKYRHEAVVATARGVHWLPFHGHEYSLKEIRMMVRPTDT